MSSGGHESGPVGGRVTTALGMFAALFYTLGAGINQETPVNVLAGMFTIIALFTLLGGVIGAYNIGRNNRR